MQSKMPLKVYYLDDEQDLCEIFVDYFASNEVEVTTFTDPAKAIDASRESPPEVLFVDYRLPGTTGDEVAKSLAAEIPKYLITGDISVKAEYTFQAIFYKPYKPEDIQQVLDGFLKIKSAA